VLLTKSSLQDSKKTQWLLVLFVFLSVFFSLTGCSGDGATPNGVSNTENPDPEDPGSGNNTELTLLSEGDSAIKVSFSVPVEDRALASEFSVPLERPKTANQLALGSYNLILPWPDFWQFKDLLPHPELFCDEPTDAKFVLLATELGGINKTTPIRIEPDATAPILQSGWRLAQRGSPVAAPIDGAESGTKVTIQRPDIIGRSENKAIYLSEIYGLITVDFTGVPSQPPQVSCALPLPGRPKNFVVTDTKLYVLLEGMKQLATGVLEFDIAGTEPVFLDGLVFENQELLDARLFNDTLALYLKTYQVVDVLPLQPDSSNSSEPAIAVDASPISYPRNRKLLHHELKVIATQPELTVTHTEVFLPRGEESTYTLDQTGQQDPMQWAYFNSFLSASGEYLVVTEQVQERYLQGFETRSSYRCTDWRVEETPYHYCRTIWKRIENPDYVPPPESGVLTCTGDLWTCILQQVPRTSRYIHVPDGEQCYDTVRRHSTCVAGETVTYDVPVYRHETYTQFHAFRFSSGEFVKLDDQLASVSGDEINVSDMPFRVSGQVQKHDHINFNSDYLYVVTRNNYTKREILHTLSILANSAVHINELVMGQDNRYASLTAIFSPETLYVGDSTYLRSGSNSDMVTISLADPIAPVITGTVNIPAQMHQLLFTGDTLLGVGYVNIPGNESRPTRNLGSLTGFTTAGMEVNSLLFGSDYRYYYSPVSYDDQVLSLDTQLKRLFVPYNVSHPLLDVQVPYNEYRVTIASYDNGYVTEDGTLAFPALPDRTMSINDGAAFAFNREFIHELIREEKWNANAVFDGEIPESIYYSHAYPAHVQKLERPNEFEFRLVDSADSAAGETLASVTVDRAVSNICTGERVLFDRDRILIVQEQPGIYISYQDCPADRNDAEKNLIGYRIEENALTLIEDQDELELLYRQSQWGLHCITNLDETNGEIISSLDAVNSSTIYCYTAAEYYNLQNTQAETVIAQEGQTIAF